MDYEQILNEIVKQLPVIDNVTYIVQKDHYWVIRCHKHKKVNIGTNHTLKLVLLTITMTDPQTLGIMLYNRPPNKSYKRLDLKDPSSLSILNTTIHEESNTIYARD